MGYDLSELKKFDNELKTLEDRRYLVEQLLDVNSDMIEGYINTSMLSGNARTEERDLNITIEQLATYLLRSEEVESSRKGEYTFYENEKRYRQYAIGKACIATDISSREDIISEHHDDKYAIDHSLPVSIYELFNFDSMTSDEKKNLIKIGLKEKENQHSELKEVMKSAYEYIMDMLVDEKDKLIVDMLIEGKKESEIAQCIGIAQPNINKRIKRICTNKI